MNEIKSTDIFPVKIQLPLTPRGALALIYDEGRRFTMFMPQKDLPPSVSAALKVYPKAYFSASVDLYGDPPTMTVHGDQMKDPGW